jgi:hypothetical protein
LGPSIKVTKTERKGDHNSKIAGDLVGGGGDVLLPTCNLVGRG